MGAFRNFDLSLIKCLERNLSNFNNNFSFYVKDQLSSDEVLQINESPKFKKVNGNLIDIFNSSNLVIISNPSSAVLDAMYMNTPFLVNDDFADCHKILFLIMKSRYCFFYLIIHFYQ